MRSSFLGLQQACITGQQNWCDWSIKGYLSGSGLSPWTMYVGNMGLGRPSAEKGGFPVMICTVIGIGIATSYRSNATRTVPSPQGAPKKKSIHQRRKSERLWWWRHRDHCTGETPVGST
jgi:hypothetical protein